MKNTQINRLATVKVAKALGSLCQEVVFVGWAPGNQWFQKGFDKAISTILDGQEIKLLPLPYFLATKFEAFFSRGSSDPYASKDLEDLVYLFNHTSNIVVQILEAPEDVRSFLLNAIQQLLNDAAAMRAIPGHLFYENAEEQYREIKQKLKMLVSSS